MRRLQRRVGVRDREGDGAPAARRDGRERLRRRVGGEAGREPQRHRARARAASPALRRSIRSERVSPTPSDATGLTRLSSCGDARRGGPGAEVGDLRQGLRACPRTGGHDPHERRAAARPAAGEQRARGSGRGPAPRRAGRGRAASPWRRGPGASRPSRAVAAPVQPRGRSSRTRARPSRRGPRARTVSATVPPGAASNARRRDAGAPCPAAGRPARAPARPRASRRDPCCARRRARARRSA